MVILEIQPVNDAQKSLSIELSKSIFVLGRSEQADLRLEYSKLSRKHLKIITDTEKRIWVQDLKSRNGSYLERNKISEQPVEWKNQQINIPGFRINKISLSNTQEEKTSCEPSESMVNTSPLQKIELRKIQSYLYKSSTERMVEREIHKKDLTKTLLQEFLNEITDTQNIDRDISQVIINAVFNEICAYGPLTGLIEDQEISDILVNGHEHIYIEKNGILNKTDLYFSSEHALNRLIKGVARKSGKRIDWNKPFLEARIEKSIRFHAIISPISGKGASISIRKFPKTALSKNELLESDVINKNTLELLISEIDKGSNFLISGATGSGKTTFLNTLAAFIPKDQRIITIEDCPELQLKHEHVLSLETRDMNADGYGEITLRTLLRNALRMRPDRIIIGECRGEEVLDLIQTLNTGHKGGMCTIHSNSCRDSLSRLELLLSSSGYQGKDSSLQKWVAGSFNFLIHMTRLKDGNRIVDEVMELKGVDSGNYILKRHFKRSIDTQERFCEKAV